MIVPFFSAEITAYQPGSSSGAEYGWLTRPWLEIEPESGPAESSITLRASNIGYVAASLDNALYPPRLVEAISIDRHLALAPGETVTSLSVGAIRLSNADGAFDDISTDYSADARLARILYGVKPRDAARGILQEPAYSSLRPLFTGLAQSWTLSEASLDIPLRDARYWLERPYQQQVYGGTGGYDGHAGIAGQTLPRTRGGSSLNPVRSVALLLIDPVARIYQYTDAAGTVINLYENAARFNINAGDTADLYSGSTPEGAYRTDNSRGLVQLGSDAVGVITADVTGAFPVAGQINFGPNQLRYILTEDLQLSADYVDVSAFTTLTSRAWVSGWHWPSGDGADGVAAIGPFLRGLGARLLPRRDGRLAPVIFGALAEDATPAGELTPATIADLRPNSLGAPLDPPAARWRVGYRRLHTVQRTGLSPLLTPAQVQIAGQEWQVAARFSATVAAAQARPSDPDIISTALLVQANAEALADEISALWGTRRRLYDVTVPLEIGMRHDIGDVVRLTYPFGDLRAGRLGRVVGEQIRTGSATSTLQVLV